MTTKSARMGNSERDEGGLAPRAQRGKEASIHRRRPICVDRGARRPLNTPCLGAVAQLGERVVRNDEASGSIPLSSTKTFPLHVFGP